MLNNLNTSLTCFRVVKNNALEPAVVGQSRGGASSDYLPRTYVEEVLAFKNAVEVCSNRQISTTTAGLFRVSQALLLFKGPYVSVRFTSKCAFNGEGR